MGHSPGSPTGCDPLYPRRRFCRLFGGLTPANNRGTCSIGKATRLCRRLSTRARISFAGRARGCVFRVHVVTRTRGAITCHRYCRGLGRWKSRPVSGPSPSAVCGPNAELRRCFFAMGRSHRARRVGALERRTLRNVLPREHSGFCIRRAWGRPSRSPRHLTGVGGPARAPSRTLARGQHRAASRRFTTCSREDRSGWRTVRAEGIRRCAALLANARSPRTGGDSVAPGSRRVHR